MVPFILTPREHHSVKDANELLLRHAAFLVKRRKRGARFDVHHVPDVMTARIDANSWMVDCSCGSGVSVDPEWGLACCFGCGAVYANIVVPEKATRDQIEAVLIAREDVFTRHWQPTESVAKLVEENIKNGMPVPDGISIGVEP